MTFVKPTMGKRRLKLNITKEIISDAKPRNSSHCMIAQAIKEACPSAGRVSVDIATVRFTDLDDGYRYTYITPRRAQQAIVEWDRGVEIEPFSLYLLNPQMTSTSATRRERQAYKEKVALGLTDSKKAPYKSQTAKMVDHPGNEIPSVVGGRPPPVSIPRGVAEDGIPFSKRRAFGIRALKI